MNDEIKIKIGSEEYSVKKSYRSLMLFEEMTGRSIGEMKESIADLLTLFYCIIKANNKQKFNKTFDEFLDMIEQEPVSVDVFNEYLISTAEKNEESQAKKKSRKQ